MATFAAFYKFTPNQIRAMTVAEYRAWDKARIEYLEGQQQWRSGN